MAISAFSLAFGADRESGAVFRWFLAAGSAVQTAKAEDAPALPQLRRSAEAGFSVIPNDLLRATLSVEGFAVDPSIPAGMVLYRGYSGFSLKGAFALSPSGLRGERTAGFVAFGASASLARYAYTELAFVEYAAFAGPGIASELGTVEFRATLPVSVALRGDAAAVSAGLLFSLNRSRRAATGERPR